MALVWFLVALVYLVVLVTLGLTTLRKGHTALFIIGLFIPVLWLLGAVMAPTRRAAGVR
jgi:hypothetical protein